MRCPTTGMYVTNLNNPLLQVSTAHSNLQQFTSIERLKFLHGALGFHPLSTLRRAIAAGYLRSFPDLTEKNVAKLPTPDATILGRLDTKRKNYQSTKSEDTDNEWTFTLKTHIINKTHDFFHKVINLEDTIYTDQTGKFRVRSISGNNYIMITYSYDTNAILVRPLRNRTGPELVKATAEVCSYLTARGYKSNHQMLDNEASTKIKEFLHKQRVHFQLVPPHLHHRNAAERAIHTFKNHFISILCGVHPDFPLHLWCKLLPQAELTLNLVRPCRYNPKLSAYEALEGNFSYNHTPLAPLGSKVIAHDTPQQRSTWAPHGHYGWLVGPAMDHYRCFTVFNPKTRGIAIASTFHWSESNRFSVPRISKEEQLVVAAKNLTSALKDGPLPCIPNQNLKSKIDLLCNIFKEASENIITTKLSPIQKESAEELSSIGAPKPSTIKPMIEKNDQHPRVEESKL